MAFDLWRSLFLDGGDDNLVSLCARCIEHQQRKAAVAGDKAEFGSSRQAYSPLVVRNFTGKGGYLITPRSEASTKRINCSTSSLSAPSARSLAMACEVLSLEFSSRR